MRTSILPGDTTAPSCFLSSSSYPTTAGSYYKHNREKEKAITEVTLQKTKNTLDYPELERIYSNKIIDCKNRHFPILGK
jgi:hypothetical protein